MRELYQDLLTLWQTLVFEQILPGYNLRPGLGREQATLLKFMRLSYQELFPEQDNFSHLAVTVEKYFSQDTPLWWVELAQPTVPWLDPIACLWLGNAVDQIHGDRHAHVFLLYVMPKYRRQGIGSALMRYAEDWAKARGDRQIGLQVFQRNQLAVHLYQRLGYQTQSLWMLKPLYR
ncbi:MAG: GNAT family N-acetyltransferase [Symploca sp. SIO2E6]|nr:GNAT family N-acetyltransferase [Symploca sp. SIO2E6]